MNNSIYIDDDIDNYNKNYSNYVHSTAGNYSTEQIQSLKSKLILNQDLNKFVQTSKSEQLPNIQNDDFYTGNFDEMTGSNCFPDMTEAENYLEV